MGYRQVLGGALLWICLTLSGCDPEPLPVPETTSAPVDLTTDQLREAVEDLMEFAGSTRVINVEITKQEVRLSVVRGHGARTYAWRSAVVVPIDSDIAYVGQTVFDPRRTLPHDLSDLWKKAADISGSDTGQKLQIVDYDQGAVYMVVTTNPESIPVFFTTAGYLVPTLDVTSALDVTIALREITSDEPVLRIGIGSQMGVWADIEAGPGQVWRTTRDRQFPVRHQLRAETTQLVSFDPRLVSANNVLKAVSEVTTSLGLVNPSWSVEVRVDEDQPQLFVTVGTRTVRASLDGVILK